jgi:hypothetical protein
MSLLLSLLLIAFQSINPQRQFEKPVGCACCYPEARQFDFWLGKWEAYGPEGQLAGTNMIVALQDSCLIQENWTSKGGSFTGTSYNFYDSKSKQWRQLWIDNQGGSLRLKGAFENGSMVLSSEELPNKENKPQTDRITWTPQKDGSVRQLWETTVDRGKTWTVVFDGLYKKIK